MKIQITDAVGNKLSFNKVPSRIVSLVPSQTELLVDLGLADSIVGVTKFCIHPANIRKNKTVVGGTKQVNFEKIIALQPDVILCNKEENTAEMVAELQQIAPVHVSEVASISEAQLLFKQYGILFDKVFQADKLLAQINSKIEKLKTISDSEKPKSALYFIWKDPWMVAGNDTYINEMMQLLGYQNVIQENRYPQIVLDAFQTNPPECILLSSEPYPFQKKHVQQLTEFFKDSKIELIDGELFSWFGTRLIK
ncbi:substrate-binding protein [Pustulibacterium marinum]|uniref:Substrate-binding protein n=1 Tax=Pustulibacterium marinum TaxID=1224947 RepID=A0A1I7FAK9_9FLAO|nr:helical backbone metal receptor [Pustulibacterium marinum]SFU33222.1 substrate-binding protein [Pustulibacterium marinum]